MGKLKSQLQTLSKQPAVKFIRGHFGLGLMVLFCLFIILYLGVIYTRYILSTPEQPQQTPLFKREVLNEKLYNEVIDQIAEDKAHNEAIGQKSYSNPF
ncbi:MAG: hypothetical protein A2666_03015 [Parcubacteria group bacterium RIFCSPHIGHO2_01_FULL_47_10b]|nr:MAG: hypothetical protein A2666_03015 [Parcubacteria group bacterium RIFCSPHIGHO2_01_FULL_47_10b]